MQYFLQSLSRIILFRLDYHITHSSLVFFPPQKDKMIENSERSNQKKLIMSFSESPDYSLDLCVNISAYTYLFSLQNNSAPLTLMRPSWVGEGVGVTCVPSVNFKNVHFEFWRVGHVPVGIWPSFYVVCPPFYHVLFRWPCRLSEFHPNRV